MPSGVVRLLFHVSGEHATLPYAEVRAILEAEGFTWERLEAFPQLLSLESDIACLRPVANRSSFLRSCGVEVFRCAAEEEEVLRRAGGVCYAEYVGEGETFSVRVKEVHPAETDAKQLERELGRIILENVPGVRVNLTNPDTVFLGVVTGDTFFFSQSSIRVPAKGFTSRRPSRRPFFHPSAMPPKLARCVVNLARAKVDGVLLDPFCGTGSLLLEAGLMGCQVIGSDVRSGMVRGSLQNLTHFGVSWLGLLAADARRIPLFRVGCVATDPPYGRSASTLGLSTADLVRDFLSDALEALPRGGFVSLSLPAGLRVGEIGQGAGYIWAESHLLREHRNLTREIAVLRKP